MATLIRKRPIEMRGKNVTRKVGLLISGLLLGFLITSTTACTERADAGDGDETVELALLMGELQRHSTKLGFAVRGENPQLSRFYLTEVGEVLNEVIAVPHEEGLPIGKPAEIIMRPLLATLDTSVATGAWPRAQIEYQALIDGCNRCHNATEHGYIEILAEPSASGFAQRFSLP